MKKLLIVTAVAVIATSSVGCCRRAARNTLYQGAICTPPVMNAPMMMPANDCCTSYSPVQSDGYVGEMSSGGSCCGQSSGASYEGETILSPTRIMPEPANNT